MLLPKVMVPVVPVVSKLVRGVPPTIPVKVTPPEPVVKTKFRALFNVLEKVTKSLDVVIVESAASNTGPLKSIVPSESILPVKVILPVVPDVDKLVMSTPAPTVLPKVNPPVPVVTVKAPAPETSPEKVTKLSVEVSVGEPESVTGPVKVCTSVVEIF